jgi:hypothetical protein
MFSTGSEKKRNHPETVSQMEKSVPDSAPDFLISKSITEGLVGKFANKN